MREIIGAAVNFNQNMNEFIGILDQLSKLTQSVVATALAILTGFCWFLSGYCAARFANVGSKTCAFRGWLICTVISFGGMICSIILVVVATIKSTDGDSAQFLYQMVSMALVAIITVIICNQAEKVMADTPAK